MKKILPILALSALLFTGCSNPSKSPLDPHADPANLYAFQAATSIGIVGQAASDVGPQALMAVDATTDTDPLADKIMSYLPAVEAALTGTDSITSSTEETGEFEGGYTLKMEISYKDMAFNNTSFTMLYNETAIVEEADPDEDEEEIETEINGVILMDDKTYQMHGSRTKEVDEMEVEFTYKVDETTIVTVKQEIEQGEQEFEYSIVKDGVEVLEYSISFEGDEVELEIEQAGQVEHEVEFDLIARDGEQLIKAEVEANEKVVATYFFKKVVAEDGIATYEIVK